MRYDTKQLPIFIPSLSEQDNSKLLPGTAIIGIEILNEEQGIVRGYYEGNKCGASNLEKFEDKCLIAAGRGVQSYPTTAWDVFKLDELEKVGYFDYENFSCNVHNKEAVSHWENNTSKDLDIDDEYTLTP